MQYDENGKYFSTEKIDICYLYIYIERDRQIDIDIDRQIYRYIDIQRDIDIGIDIFKIVLIATSSFDTNKTTEIFSMKLC